MDCLVISKLKWGEDYVKGVNCSQSVLLIELRFDVHCAGQR